MHNSIIKAVKISGKNFGKLHVIRQSFLPPKFFTAKVSYYTVLVFESPVTLTYNINLDLPYASGIIEIIALNKVIIIIFTSSNYEMSVLHNFYTVLMVQFMQFVPYTRILPVTLCFSALIMLKIILP